MVPDDLFSVVSSLLIHTLFTRSSLEVRTRRGYQGCNSRGLYLGLRSFKLYCYIIGQHTIYVSSCTVGITSEDLDLRYYLCILMSV